MRPPEILAALTPVAEALEAMGVAYHVGGSVASSAHGMARATLDVDLVAELRQQDVEPLVNRLSPAYYIDGDSLRNAIASTASFNLIHLETMVKIDVFVPAARSFDREVQRRASRVPLDEDPIARTFPVKSPEDIVLTKLEWHAQGGEASAKQWSDVLGVIRVQDHRLDLDHLRRWAGALGVADLLERALKEARFE
jgi:hypothetical protein